MAKEARWTWNARCAGFTLLEALVALAVMAILMGLAVPQGIGLRERQQLQAQAEDFWSSLMLARSQALLHQAHVTVCAASPAGCDATAGWHAGWWVFVDGNRNGRRDADEPLLLQRGGTPTSVQVVGNSTVSHVIGYGAEGRSEGLGGGFQAGTVRLCAAGLDEGWRVVINAVGRPRLEKADISTCP